MSCECSTCKRNLPKRVSPNSNVYVYPSGYKFTWDVDEQLNYYLNLLKGNGKPPPSEEQVAEFRIFLENNPGFYI